MNETMKSTTQERTGLRSLEISQWMRKNLKNSHLGLSISDIDGIFHEYNKKVIMLIEFKTFNRTTTFAQRQMFEVLDRCIKIGAPAIGYDYRGFFLIRMDGKCPETSNQIEISEVGTLNGRSLITKNELIKFLNFEININL